MITLGLFILLIISQGVLLDKANDQWWKILIPFYGEYSMYKIARKKALWFVKFIIAILATIVLIVLLVNFVGTFIQTMSSYVPSISTNQTLLPETSVEIINVLIENIISNQVLIISFLLLSMFSLVSDIIRIVYYVGLSHSFGKSGVFAVGLFFLNVIFLPILAFSKDAEYVGNEELIE